MGKRSDLKEIAKARWLAGEDISAIARDLGLHRNTVQGWKKRDGWEKIRDALPDEPIRRPQLVSFERDRTPTRKAEISPPMPDLNTMEGQLALVDQMIEASAKQILNPQSPQMYAASLNGLSKLLNERRQILPINNVELVKELCLRYRDPGELLKEMRAAGFAQEMQASKVTPIKSRL